MFGHDEKWCKKKRNQVWVPMTELNGQQHSDGNVQHNVGVIQEPIRQTVTDVDGFKLASNAIRIPQEHALRNVVRNFLTALKDVNEEVEDDRMENPKVRDMGERNLSIHNG